MLRPFTLHRPSTLTDVADLLAEHRDEAVLYAGGTEILLLMKEGLLRPRHLIDVKRVPGLDTIAVTDGRLSIGATAHHRTVERSSLVHERCPILAGVARHVANVRVRNVGTVGGNLAFADPHSDLATLFLALDGTVTLWSRRGERELSLPGFVRGAYETTREEDEVLTAVRLRPWPAGTAAAYLKFGVYERPTLGVAVAIRPDAGGRSTIRVAVGCVGPRPQRLHEVERRAAGEPPAGLDALGEELGAMATREVDAVDDRHGSAEYKREMTGVFVRRALRVATARAQGQETHARYAYTVTV
jgi:aerobic carbon-monoxide dehydrogenase medium subunit